MKIERVRIWNYRSIRELDVYFDSVTALIGPNGAGKSNVLRAVDWFFNGPKMSLTDQDVHRFAPEGSQVEVEILFTDLSSQDRTTLGNRYCPKGDEMTFTLRRTWSAAEDKLTGKAMANADFEQVRSHDKAGDKKTAYQAIRQQYGLPAWTNANDAETAMTAWESANPQLLVEASVSATHFFGATGNSILGGLFDFIFVSADLRSDELSDSKGSVLDQIIRRAIDTTAQQEALTELSNLVNAKQIEISASSLGPQLDEIGEKLTNAVATYNPGRTIAITAEPTELRVPSPALRLAVEAPGLSLPVSHQGHGFQRTMLVACLQLLAEVKTAPGGQAGACLAIEEPELYQHPTQCRAFASVLRAIASDAHSSTQVAYATHSPHFIRPEYFDQVRRVSTSENGDGSTQSMVSTASISDIVARLHGFIDPSRVESRFEQVCLKHIPDALFAQQVLLVEGDDDAAVLEELGKKINPLAVLGVCVAPVSGKNGMMMPYAILESLRIPTTMVVDNDSNCGTRMTALGRSEVDIQSAEDKHKKDNRALCQLVGADEEDYPVGEVTGSLVFVPDTMESLLDSHLPGWSLTRDSLIETGRGVDGKHAATYGLAVRETDATPGEPLASLASTAFGLDAA